MVSSIWTTRQGVFLEDNAATVHGVMSEKASSMIIRQNELVFLCYTRRLKDG